MPTSEQTVDMQRSTIEQLRDEIESLKQELEDYRELQQQRFVAKQVGYVQRSMWSHPLVATGWVTFIAIVAIGFYQGIRPGLLGMILTIATMALLAFGIASIGIRPCLSPQPG